MQSVRRRGVVQLTDLTLLPAPDLDEFDEPAPNNMDVDQPAPPDLEPPQPAQPDLELAPAPPTPVLPEAVAVPEPDDADLDNPQPDDEQSPTANPPAMSFHAMRAAMDRDETRMFRTTGDAGNPTRAP